MIQPIKTLKTELRQEYIGKRRAIGPEQKKELDDRITQLFLSSITYRYSAAVLLYAPLDDEIDVNEIAKQALSAGKIVAFPKCNVKDNTMEYRIVHDLSELVPGALDILEPAADTEIYDYIARAQRDHAVCIVPGVVFDIQGYRIGYGRGFYDRFLNRFEGVKVGLAYSNFILKTIPRGRYDLPCDVIVSEKGVRAIG